MGHRARGEKNTRLSQNKDALIAQAQAMGASGVQLVHRLNACGTERELAMLRMHVFEAICMLDGESIARQKIADADLFLAP
jgi:hypothetical protein